MTRRHKAKKPEPPYDGFPLSAHPSGQWCKRIRGTLHFFGRWDDPDAALAKYLEQRDYLQSGTTSPVQRRTVADLLNKFGAAKQAEHDLGEITTSHWNELLRVTDAIADHLGKSPAA